MTDQPDEVNYYIIDYSKATDWKTYVQLKALIPQTPIPMSNGQIEVHNEKVKSCLVKIETDRIKQPEKPRESGLILPG
jgi:hypothetical protein